MSHLVLTSSFWLDKRVFVTGHTGFKGAWLSLMLARLNARAAGYALDPPTEPSLYELAKVGEALADDIRADVRDAESLRWAMTSLRPEIVIHMAAQPLVRAAYADPAATYATNVMGTVNLLEAVRATPGVKLVLVVTTDKCYENNDWVWGYRENDRLGGRDPYSNSKACAELVAGAFRDSYFTGEGAPIILTARAGNVIGGGDFAPDRIIPDAVRAFLADRDLLIRNPDAVRPFQHVLEPLVGYLALIEKAMSDPRGEVRGAFNFGPGAESEQSVETLISRFIGVWGQNAKWRLDGERHPHEARLLRLDVSKAQQTLGWTPLLDFADTVDWTANWYRSFAARADLREATLLQLDRYLGQRVRLTSPLGEPQAERAGDAAPRGERLSA